MLNYKKFKESLYLCNPYDKTEIEIKFSDYSQDFAVISSIQMRMLLSTLKTERQLTTVLLNDHARKINVQENYKIINYIYDENYKLHCYITQLTENDEHENYNKVIEKIEYYYSYKNYNLILSENVSNNMTTYEAVIRFNVDLLNDAWMTELDPLIKSVLLILNDTKVLYTAPQYKTLIKDCETCLNEKLDNVLNKPIPVELTNLEFNEPYIISTKAKGLRKMLIIHTSGVWLVNPPFYNLLTNVQNNLTNAWHLTIFDGELIKPLNQNEYEFNFEYWYLAYDCLCFERDVRHKHYIDRIDIAKTFNSIITSFINPSYFKFTLKTTRVALYKEEIIEKIRYLLDLPLNYDHDGLIFTPAYQGYNDPVYKWTIPSHAKIGDITLSVDGVNLRVFDETMIMPETSTKYKNTECRWPAIMEEMSLIKINNNSVDLVLENWKNINNNPLSNNEC
jgi:hypothetical protein